MSNVIDQMQSNQYGIHSENKVYTKEFNEVKKYYQFYNGKPDFYEDSEETYGQQWGIPEDLEYKPTIEVRNITKKLIQKQSRFMFGVEPSIELKPVEVGEENVKKAAEEKRILLDTILKDTSFWSKTKKAFTDATIGKRVLMFVAANPGEEIKIRYFLLPQFECVYNKDDNSKLDKVTISYQDESTLDKVDIEQIWHIYEYEMKDGYCWYHYEMRNGKNENIYIKDKDDNDVKVQEDSNTFLTQIPCYVICNGGLTGDFRGTSDVKELIDMANSYNHTVSDYRDALRFKMFEMPVFIDADEDSISEMKIAPGAVMSIKTDATMLGSDGSGGKTAQVTSTGSTFNWVTAADSYLDRLKKDMYEHMDQPLPENLKDVPSAKALKFLYYDLIARCEEKWMDWTPAIEWLVGFLEEAIDKFNLYQEKEGSRLFGTETMLNIKHNYPLRDDETEQKETAIAEVEANVKSRKTYIKEFGLVEDYESEWNEIMAEQDELNNSTNTGFMNTLDDELSNSDENDENDENEVNLNEAENVE